MPLNLKQMLHAGLAFVFAVLLLVPSALAQTYRGELSGIVVDTQGAVIAKAPVILKNPATGIIVNGVSNHVGEFNFPELAPGVYAVSVAMPGFETTKIDNINVAVSSVATVRIELKIGSSTDVVDVEANGVQVESDSSQLVSVVDSKAVQDEPINGRDFTKMIRFTAGVVGSGYANGSSSINFQVDGVDNVDLWLGIVASNQGGIASVPGGLIPIEAIDQFSVQSQGEADNGRNTGANQNMVMKSGTNQIHGDVFFYNRNEFFAAIEPVAPVGSRKQPIRNNQFGFTLGGPIHKDKTFLFLAGEIQLASAGNAINSTVLNDAWVGSTAQNGNKPSLAQQFVNNYQGVAGLNPTPNAITSALYTNIFRTSANPNTGAVTNNYFISAPNQYNSYNSVIKLDHHWSESEYTSARYIGTTGKQTAYIGSAYASMYQTAPMHIHNGSIIHTSIITPKMLNQLTLGVNSFLQTFNDANQSYFPCKNDGLCVGSQPANIADGSPTVSVTGFTPIGETQPSGRQDVTGQLNDSFRWTLGKHSIKIGMEYRHFNGHEISLGSSRGSFSFTGTAGPWSGSSTLFTPTVTAGCLATDPLDEAATVKNGVVQPYTSAQVSQCAAQYCYAIGGQAALNQTGPSLTGKDTDPKAAFGETCLSNILSSADFLLGATPPSTGSSSLRVGVGTRTYTINTFDSWLQDDLRATQRLTLNYGVRWSIPGVPNDAQNDLTSWTPTGTPGSAQGSYAQPIYANYYKAIAPRLGFAWTPFQNGKTVLRGAWGIIYNTPSLSSMVNGTAGNPAGPDPSYVGTANLGILGSSGSSSNLFSSTTAPATLAANGINRGFAMTYQENFSLGIEQQLARNTLLSVGYSGSEARRTQVSYDFNQASGCRPSINASGVTTTAITGCPYYTRPFDSAGGGAPCSNALGNATLTSPGCLFFANQVIPATSPFGALRQLTSGGIANFNSLNVSVRQAVWKGISFTANYIWSKKMDDGSTPTTNSPSTNAANCLNCVNGAFPDGIKGPGIKMDYGVGSGNTAHTFDGFVSYSLPKYNHLVKLTNGWQMNALWSFYTGAALNPTIGGTEYSLQGESGDRPSYIPGLCISNTNCSAKATMAKKVYTTSTGARVYITQNANVVQDPKTKAINSVTNTFSYPIPGVSVPYYNPTGAYGTAVANTNTFGIYGNMRRDTLIGTAFGDVDFSLFKYTPITEKVKSEFRVEIFNLFNQSNLANPSVTAGGAAYGEITNTLNASGNPGMGYGEPFNIQLALKILF